jgi:pimeloyl-ACP methyl ester carboxylesterase
MNRTTFESKRQSVETASGHVSYVESGKGPAALFIHGVLLNGYLWHHQLTGLADMCQCIALDLLAHGASKIEATQDVSSDAQATMVTQFLDALKPEQVDLVGNDSGSGIAQIFAANNPERVRTLTLTNGDAHDNWPPEAFKGFLAMAARGGLRGALEKMLSQKDFFRSDEGLGLAYERAEEVADETIEVYLRPFLSSPQRIHDLERFLAAFNCEQTVRVESRLRALKAPTLIVWGTDDIFFDVKWSHWLATMIPGTRRRVEFKGARLFFPEERWKEFNDQLRAHWSSAP